LLAEYVKLTQLGYWFVVEDRCTLKAELVLFYGCDANREIL